MELIAGDELDTFIEKQLTLSLWSKVYVLLNILQGLRHLVSQKIVHLDLKPSNIIVSRNYITKIIDFGEAYHHNVCSSGNKGPIQITCLDLLFLILLRIRPSSEEVVVHGRKVLVQLEARCVRFWCYFIISNLQ